MSQRAQTFILAIEFAHQGNQAGIVAQVLGRTSTENQDGGEFLGGDGRYRDLAVDIVAGAFHVSVPTRFGIVENEVQPAARGSGVSGTSDSSPMADSSKPAPAAIPRYRSGKCGA